MSHQPGKRIAVWGMSCSGKTTVAAELARYYGLSHIELDSIYWKPGWEPSPSDEYRRNLSAAMEACLHGWVIDGNYAEIQDLVLPQADTVVWLQIPLPVILWRLLRRTVGRIVTGKVLWGTNRETWKDGFFGRDSLFRYVISTWRTYPEKRRRLLTNIPHQARLIELRSGKEIRKFLEDCDGIRSSSTASHS